MRHIRAVMLSALLLSALAATSQQLTTSMSNKDVMDMVALGLSDDVVIDKIHSATATAFDTSLDGLKALKAAKVSDAVIRAMINPHPAPVAGTQAPAAPGNPNDPDAAHDAGIYMYAKSRDGVQMTLLEPTVYSQGKTGGMFTSAMTYGIAKVKWKAVVRGAHATVRSSDDKAAFYFYFEESNAGLSHATYAGTTTPNEFQLIRFDEKKDSRETVVMKGNAFGASSGTDDKANIPFTFTKIKPGVFKVVPNAPLKPGEYCFLTSSGVGTFGAGAAGANRLYDFGIAPPE